MPDSGAAGVSTAGEPQFRALQKLMPYLLLDRSTAGHYNIRFGKGNVVSIGTTNVPTTFGIIPFQVVPANTPILLCINDMHRLGIKFENIKNVLKQGKLKCAVTRKWGHPWLLLHLAAYSQLQQQSQYGSLNPCCLRMSHPQKAKEENVTWSNLTESKLRRIHCRFGHPSVQRLHRILIRSSHDFDRDMIKRITKYCQQCQMNEKFPARFKFKLKEDLNFNTEIIVDIMYLDGKQVVHVVDSATSFQAARFIKDISAKKVWKAIRLCWIDVYQGLPDFIVHDVGTRFASADFKQEAKVVGSVTKKVPIEAHQSVGKVERYHACLRRSHQVIKENLPGVNKEIILQMSVKAINGTAGPNSLVPTLLVFGTFPRLTESSTPSPLILQRAEAIYKATKELKCLYAERLVKDALRMRNGPNTEPTLKLSLQSQEEDESILSSHAINESDSDSSDTTTPLNSKIKDNPPNITSQPNVTTRGRDKLKTSHKFYDACHTESHLSSFSGDVCEFEIYLATKEKLDMELSIKLRDEGIITTEGSPFQQADTIEIEGLLASGIFDFEIFVSEKHGNLRIFNSRMVRIIEGKGTTTPYEKSRLVIQGHYDEGRRTILTQSATIQRSSQRIIVALAPSLRSRKLQLNERPIPGGNYNAKIKALYGIAEAGLHWFSTHFKHHQEKLQMKTFTYDLCMLISNSSEKFAIVGMQTDDTLILSDDKWSRLEETELKNAGFRAKSKKKLTSNTPLIFNGRNIRQEKENLTLQQKQQGKRLTIVDIKSPSMRRQYVEQRARAAYIASICQPEAAFDFSVPTQCQNPEKDEVITLNKRLKWQIDNLNLGLTLIPIELKSAKLYVFVDGSFANNKDLSSQIGFVVVIANEQLDEDQFSILGNLLHWSSIKSNRITRSSLVSEILAIVGGVDIGIAIWSTLQIISEKLSIPSIPLVVCTDSYSLYQCFVKLGSTTDKRLMVDIMHLLQSYERREISEIRWINGNDNPADTMTKSNPNNFLKILLTITALLHE